MKTIFSMTFYVEVHQPGGIYDFVFHHGGNAHQK